MRAAAGPLILAVVLIGAAGAVHGVQTDRWGPSIAIEHSLARLANTPRACGEWRGEDVSYEPDDMARAGIKGCVFRSYQNAATRESVSILLVCGRGGPISVHTPDVCYAGAGYGQLTEAQTKEVALGDGRAATFWAARFGKPGVVPTQLEIYWAWSRDGVTWEAPVNPRLSLARSPALYKLYVIRQYTAGTREEGADACRTFLQAALPEFAHTLDQASGP